MAEELTRSARDELVQRIYQLEASLFRRPGAPELTMAERPLAKERLFATYGEYADRLPRVRLSSCPYCGEPLKRVFDPFGMDGPWWHVDVQVKYDEPAACDHFRVLLGAVNLGDRVPEEVRGEVRPGPEVPFVVPALLALPGMLAVVGRLQLATGDVAYPIAYFSDQPTRPVSLHQPWCRNMYWFQTDDGRAAWSTANDIFDFDLRPYVESGQLRWVDLAADESEVLTGAREFPFFAVGGVRERQQIASGERAFLGLPTGEPLDPFDG
jgi:hypothetical protein